MWILNIYMHFCLCKWNWGTDFIFLLFIKISCQSKEFSALSKQPSFSLTPPFLEKIFHPHLYCQIRGTQSLLYKGGEGSNYVYIRKTLFIFVPIFNMGSNFSYVSKHDWNMTMSEIWDFTDPRLSFWSSKGVPFSLLHGVLIKEKVWQNMKQMILCFFSKEFSCLLTGENSKSK